MNTATLSTYKHPNAYTWSGNDIKNVQATDQTVYELSIQIAALNRQINQLKGVVDRLVSDQNLETLKNRHYNI